MDGCYGYCRIFCVQQRHTKRNWKSQQGYDDFIAFIQNEFNFLGALILSFLTAVGGGTIRDILINRVPSILVSEFYATVALIIATIMFMLEEFGIRNLASITIVFIFGVALRLLAYYKNWHLPTLSKD